MPQEPWARKTAIIPVLAIAALIGACAAREPIQVQGSSRDAGAVERGAYLADAVAHCGECHTPRTALGGLDDDRRFRGSMAAKSGIRAPDISSDGRHGIGAWNAGEIADFLKSGMTPQGDFAGGAMGEVIESTSKLSDADHRAIGAYLRSAAADRHGL